MGEHGNCCTCEISLMTTGVGQINLQEVIHGKIQKRIVATTGRPARGDLRRHVAFRSPLHRGAGLLFFKDGQVVDQVVGVVSKQVIAEKLSALVDEGAILRN